MTTKTNYLIGIAGNIGVGKTTLTKKIAEKLAWKSYFESVIDNPYLNVIFKFISSHIVSKP
jgi:deoxyadenosine/deoxycytidine kinase